MNTEQVSEVVKGTRCVLLPFREDYAEELARVANNPNVARNLLDRFPHPYSLKDAVDWITFCQRNDNGRRFCICVEEEEATAEDRADHLAKQGDDVPRPRRWQPVGGIEAMEVAGGGPNFRHRAEIGYWLAESHWGRGIMTDAVTAFVRYLFSDDFAQRWNGGQDIVR